VNCEVMKTGNVGYRVYKAVLEKRVIVEELNRNVWGLPEPFLAMCRFVLRTG